MKLIIRGDDMGYSEAFNYGYWKCIEEGILTSAELMIGMPGTLQAVEMLKKVPWMPVGWHIHVCGLPSADPELVKDLLNEKGELKLHISRGHPQDKGLYPQLRIELEAELHKFIEYLGKKPDLISNVDDKDDPYSQVLRELSEEYHINHLFRDFTNNYFSYKKWVKNDKGEWIKEDYPYVSLQAKRTWGTVQEQADHYDSRKMFLEDNDELLRSDQVGLAVLHPGYLDEYIFRNTTCNVARCIDVGTLTDPIVKRHLDDLGVELITSNDYLFGTDDYQNYLRLKTAKY